MLISGQFRTFRDAWAHNLSRISSPNFDVDFFVDVWSEVGATSRSFVGYSKSIGKTNFDPFTYRWKGEKMVTTEMIDKTIPGASIQIHSSVSEVIAADERLELIIKNVPTEIRQMAISSVAMFYLWKKSIEHMQKVGGNYEKVLRIRPDWVLRRNVLEELGENHKDEDLVFFDSSQNFQAIKWGYVSDVCFGGSRGAVSLACTIFDDWVDLIVQEGWVCYENAATNHFGYLVSESALSYFVRGWRSQANIGAALPHAGYILREGKDVTTLKSLVIK